MLIRGQSARQRVLFISGTKVLSGEPITSHCLIPITTLDRRFHRLAIPAEDAKDSPDVCERPDRRGMAANWLKPPGIGWIQNQTEIW